MTVTKDQASFIISSPQMLIASVPGLIGFVPIESMIAVWFKDGHILVTQRADIEHMDKAGEFYGPVMAQRPEEVAVVFWTDNYLDKEKALEFVDAIPPGVVVRDVMWVTRDQWGSLLCHDPECCPPGGKPIDYSLSPLHAEVSQSREVLRSETKPVGTGTRPSVRPKGRVREEWRDAMIATAVSAYVDSDEADYAEIGGALHDIRVRDSLMWMAVAQDDPDDMKRAYEVAAAAARAMSPEDAAPACTVAAFLAWQAGDGARANIAIDHALAAHNAYPLAVLMYTALASGVNPVDWREAMTTLTFETVRNGTRGE